MVKCLYTDLERLPLLTIRSSGNMKFKIVISVIILSMNPFNRILCFLCIAFLSCKKGNDFTQTNTNPPPAAIVPVQAELIGGLHQARHIRAVAGTSNVIAFAGGDSNQFVSNIVDLFNKTSNSWTYRVASVFPEYALAVQDKILIGGSDQNQVPAAVMEIYHTQTETWVTVPLLNPWAGQAGITSFENKVYFAGGGPYNFSANTYSPSKDVAVYDLTTGTWTMLQLSEARGLGASAAVNGRIVFAGGMNAAMQPSRTVDIYNTANSSWSTHLLSAGRWNIHTVTAGNRVFFIGGNDDNINYRVVDMYDGLTNTWTAFSLLGDRYEMSLLPWNNVIYLAGGDVGYFESIDVNACTSFSRPLSGPRSAVGIGTAGNKIYFIGGSPYQTGARYFSDVVEILDLSNGEIKKGSLQVPNGAGGYKSYKGSYTTVNLGDDILLAGGADSSGNPVRTVYKVKR